MTIQTIQPSQNIYVEEESGPVLQRERRPLSLKHCLQGVVRIFDAPQSPAVNRQLGHVRFVVAENDDSWWFHDHQPGLVLGAYKEAVSDGFDSSVDFFHCDCGASRQVENVLAPFHFADQVQQVSSLSEGYVSCVIVVVAVFC